MPIEWRVAAWITLAVMSLPTALIWGWTLPPQLWKDVPFLVANPFVAHWIAFTIIGLTSFEVALMVRQPKKK